MGLLLRNPFKKVWSPSAPYSRDRPLSPLKNLWRKSMREVPRFMRQKEFCSCLRFIAKPSLVNFGIHWGNEKSRISNASLDPSRSTMHYATGEQLWTLWWSMTVWMKTPWSRSLDTCSWQILQGYNFMIWSRMFWSRSKTSIILGRPFLESVSASVDEEQGTIKLEVEGKHEKFTFHTMDQMSFY